MSQATFIITSWDETPIEEFPGGKLTQAKVTQTYTGDIEGSAKVEYLMSHFPDGSASFVGMERVTGSIAGKSGHFVIRHVGSHDANGAASEWTIVPNSGTDELLGLSGSGSYLATAETVETKFEYELV